MTDTIVRTEINSLTSGQASRIQNALIRMRIGGSRSIYAKICSIHGWPSSNPFCKHGVPEFAPWHSLYIILMEYFMRKADRELGNNGNIRLPYWDPSVSGGHRIPTWVRNNFGNLDDINEGRTRNMLLRWNSDSAILNDLNNRGVVRDYARSLYSDNIYDFMSTGNNGRWNVERPHNAVHMILGSPMSSVPYASYDVMFWFHHCNVDRYFSSYIIEDGDRAARYFPRSDNVMSPFRINPRSIMNYILKNGDPGNMTHNFYDRIPIKQMSLYEEPIYLLFKSCKIRDIKINSGYIEAYINTKDGRRILAGSYPIFSRPGICQGCDERPPFDITIDIGPTLKNENIKLKDLDLTVVAEEEGKYITETGLPNYIISRPFIDRSLSIGNNSDKIVQLQRLLKRYDLYDGEEDYKFGPITEKSVKKMQKLMGMKQDGIFNPELIKKRICNPESILKSFNQKNISYWTGRSEYDVQIKKAFKEWEAFSKYKFTKVHGVKKANILLVWGDACPEGLKFDGQGGEMARVVKNTLTFDNDEEWNPDKVYRVALHEIGHILGYPHLDRPGYVMSPFYSDTTYKLTPYDVGKNE